MTMTLRPHVYENDYNSVDSLEPTQSFFSTATPMTCSVWSLDTSVPC
jgi:hypothetical protein